MTRNNLLVYLAPLLTLGSLSAATAVLSHFDYVVIAMPSVGAIAGTLEVLNALKTLKPTIAVFGRVDASLPSINADIAAWVTAVPAGLLAGLYCENFGTVEGTSRVSQNAIVFNLHTANLACFASSADAFEVFEPLPGQPDPYIGRSPLIKDYFVFKDFHLVNGAGHPTLAQATDDQLKSDYATAALHDRLSPVPGTLVNVGFGAIAGAGTDLLIPANVYQQLLSAITKGGFTMLGVAPSDNGLASHTFFLTNTANQIV